MRENHSIQIFSPVSCGLVEQLFATVPTLYVSNSLPTSTTARRMSKDTFSFLKTFRGHSPPLTQYYSHQTQITYANNKVINTYTFTILSHDVNNFHNIRNNTFHYHFYPNCSLDFAFHKFAVSQPNTSTFSIFIIFRTPNHNTHQPRTQVFHQSFHLVK